MEWRTYKDFLIDEPVKMRVPGNIDLAVAAVEIVECLRGGIEKYLIVNVPTAP